MKKCVLDGSRLAGAAEIYRELAEAFGFPEYFGDNPDALWDALGDYRGQPVTVIWRHAARSAHQFGPRFAEIVAVLQRAAAEGTLTLELA
ncbi:MAG TPA: barstar family protein [Stellaceae bacterium]|nr:barstar family protein [Stellaceae bacterium]